MHMVPQGPAWPLTWHRFPSVCMRLCIFISLLGKLDLTFCALMWHAHMHFPAVSREGGSVLGSGEGRGREGISWPRRKVRGGRRRTGPADCWRSEPNRWWRLGDVPSPGLSSVIEDNLSAKESRPVHCQALRAEMRLIWEWFCITAGFGRLATILILARGSGNEEVSP